MLPGRLTAAWEEPGAPRVAVGAPHRHGAALGCPTGTAPHLREGGTALRAPSGHLQGRAAQLAGRGWFKSTTPARRPHHFVTNAM